MCAAIGAITCNRSVTLLPGRIPDLQFDALILPKDGLNLKIDADGADERGREGIVGITEELEEDDE